MSEPLVHTAQAAASATRTQPDETSRPDAAPAFDARVGEMSATAMPSKPEASPANTMPPADAHAAGMLATLPVAATLPISATAAAPAARTASVGHTATLGHVGPPATLPHAPTSAGSIGGAVLALVLVIGLILALAWLAKRLPGFRGAAGAPALRVVASLALGPRERVVVVAVGDTQLLLGVGAGGMRTLHTLSQPLPVAASTTSPAFAQVLAQHFGKKA
jgi:flagellar protein FliO/FliZ